jgi:CRP/FNR family transcriptional regulator
VADGQEHHCTAEAMSPATLCRFQKAQFERHLEVHPALLGALYRRAVSNAAALEAQIILLGRKTALERLASFLLDIHRRIAHGPEGAAMKMVLPMNRTDIADYLGITKETVCRRLTQLKGAHIIKLHSANNVEILDLKRLDDMARGRVF